MKFSWEKTILLALLHLDISPEIYFFYVFLLKKILPLTLQHSPCKLFTSQCEKNQQSTWWAGGELLRRRLHRYMSHIPLFCSLLGHSDDERRALPPQLRVFGGKRDWLPNTDSVKWNERSLLVSFFFFLAAAPLKCVTELEQTRPGCPCPKVTLTENGLGQGHKAGLFWGM